MSGPGLAPPRVPPLRWGVALPLLLAVAAQVELHLSYSAEEAQGEVLSPVNAAVAALATLPLALSGRAPLLAPLVATGAWAAEPLGALELGPGLGPAALLGVAAQHPAHDRGARGEDGVGDRAAHVVAAVPDALQPVEQHHARRRQDRARPRAGAEHGEHR